MIKETYNQLVNTKLDINEHLPTLKLYAEKCSHVTEMGVRDVVSTFAFILGNPKKMISIDIKHPRFFNAEERLNQIIEYADENNIDFKFIECSSLDIEIENTDLLFIDTWHCYQQLIQELNLHAKNVNKYIILHDTTLYETQEEQHYGQITSEKHGLWVAIEEFLESNENWIIEKRFINNNGLTILKNTFNL
jgi:hypothetical protein